MVPKNRMIVPQFWATARLQHKERRKQITVRRFGWSDSSQQEAQMLAEARAAEAMQRLLSGEKLLRRERRQAYNGAHGVPIREEIIRRDGNTIITRNAYGARCLNTPNVLFADIDFALRWSGRYFLICYVGMMLLAFALAALTHSVKILILTGVIGLLVSGMLALSLQRMVQRFKGGPERIARKRITQFLARHPDWKLRLYATPAGMRVMAVHKLFDANSPEVAEFFSALAVDPIYARMCRNQHCFRARLSAKPWRIGVARLKGGVWPVPPQKEQERKAWVERYEAAAEGFAACRYLETLGNGATHPEAHNVQALHDELSRATSSLPLA